MVGMVSGNSPSAVALDCTDQLPFPSEANVTVNERNPIDVLISTAQL